MTIQKDEHGMALLDAIKKKNREHNKVSDEKHDIVTRGRITKDHPKYADYRGMPHRTIKMEDATHFDVYHPRRPNR
jgi:hypothetical protein